MLDIFTQTSTRIHSPNYTLVIQVMAGFDLQKHLQLYSQTDANEVGQRKGLRITLNVYLHCSSKIIHSICDSIFQVKRGEIYIFLNQQLHLEVELGQSCKHYCTDLINWNHQM